MKSKSLRAQPRWDAEEHVFGSVLSQGVAETAGQILSGEVADELTGVAISELVEDARSDPDVADSPNDHLLLSDVALPYRADLAPRSADIRSGMLDVPARHPKPGERSLVAFLISTNGK